MSNSEPYEIIANPFDAWIGPVGESFPDLADTPAGNWVKLGSSGYRNQEDDGLIVQHTEAIEIFRGQGTGPLKAVRTEEDMIVRLTLVDLRLEVYRYALDGVTVAPTAAGAATAGYKSITLYKGVQVATVALLVKGAVSPYGSDWNSQYQIPVVFEEGQPEVQYNKGSFSGIQLQYRAQEDPNAGSDAARFGSLLQQTAAPTG